MRKGGYGKMTNNLKIHKNPSQYAEDRQSELGRQILDVLNGGMHEYGLEELLNDFPSYTWNQVFLEVDRMSRTGSLRLLSRGPGLYAVCLPVETAQPQPEERLLVNV
jgi:hypothetical protein